MSRFFRPETGLFLGLWLLLMIGGRSKFFLDPGTFWHTVVGEEILGPRGFFDTDDLTYTFAGQPWIPHQWLGECAMALVHRVAGFDSLLLLTATILTTLYTWLGVRLLRAGLHPILVVVFLGLTLAASSGHFHVRPHLATIVCFALTMSFLIDADRGRIALAHLGWLVPIYWLWANTHGGVLGGLATFGLALAGWTVNWLKRRDSPINGFRDVLLGGVIWLACAGVSFVNPYGARLPLTWLDIYQSSILPTFIKEHAHLSLQQADGWMVLILGAGYVGLLVSTRQWPRVAWLLPIVWLLLACDRVRHAPLFAVAAVLGLADFFPFTRWANSMVERGSDLYTPPSPTAPRRTPLTAWLAPIALVLTTLGLQAARIQAPVVGIGWARLDPTVWPMELLPKLWEHEKPGTHIFNEYNQGGFLIYYAPGYKVFVDDRCELFGDAWLLDYDKLKSSPTAAVEAKMNEWQTKYGRFAYALTTPGSHFDLYFKADPEMWEEIAASPTGSFYRRR